MAQTPTRARRKGAVFTGYRVGCIAFDVRQQHPWPVVLTTGNNLEYLKTNKARQGVLRHAANGHNYSAKVEAGRAYVRNPPNLFSGSGRALRSLRREEVNGLANFCEDVLRPDAQIWRTKRLRDAIVVDPDQCEVTGPELPAATASGSSSKRKKEGLRMTIGATHKGVSASTEKRHRGEDYVDTEYCVSYFGDNSFAWVPERYLKPFTLERLGELKSWLTTEGQAKLKYEGAMKEQFLRAVVEALHLVKWEWLPPSGRLRCGDFVLVRHGAEPPFLATVALPRAEALWKEKTRTRPAEYVQRVEVTYYTEDKTDSEAEEEGVDGDGCRTDTATPPDEADDGPGERCSPGYAGRRLGTSCRIYRWPTCVSSA